MAGKTSKTEQDEAPKLPTASVRNLSKHARAVIGDGFIDLYPAIASPLALTNGSVMSAPVDVELELTGCIGLVMPNPSSASKRNIVPVVNPNVVPEGCHTVTSLLIRNNHWRSQYVDPKDPIARILLLPWQPVPIDLVPFTAEKKVA